MRQLQLTLSDHGSLVAAASTTPSIFAHTMVVCTAALFPSPHVCARLCAGCGGRDPHFFIDNHGFDHYPASHPPSPFPPCLLHRHEAIML